MDKRREELMKIKSYTEEIDNELTIILQNLQWDRQHLLQNSVMVTCRYDSNHKLPPDKRDEHEKECFLLQNGYTNDDRLLPDASDSDSTTLVKLSKGDIEQIIGNAARSDPLFKKGVGCRGAEPMSLERLQSSYSSDERRAIHDAVVSAVPACHDLTDLALLSGGDVQGSQVKILSRAEILAELRNMRRRRTKYRVAAKTRNYSDVLRDVIKTQMEHYNEGQSETTLKEHNSNKETDNSVHSDNRNYRQGYSSDDKNRYERRRQDMSRPIKREREDSIERNRDYNRERSDRACRYEDRARERREKDRDRRKYERSREKRNSDDLERVDKYAEKSRKRRYDEAVSSDHRGKERTRGTKYDSSKEIRNNDHSDRQCEPDKRSKRRDKYRDSDLVNQVKREPSYDEDKNKRKDRSRERRRDGNTDKHHKHKDRTSDRKYDESHRRDRRRSRERRQKDKRYKERSSEGIYIKQEREDSAERESNIKDNRFKDRPSEIMYIKKEREDSATREEISTYETYKSNDRRHKNYEERNDKSYREKSYDSYTDLTERSTKQPYERYYGSTEAIYDPNKKIKVEK